LCFITQETDLFTNILIYTASQMKELFAPPANSSMVGTSVTVGDVTDIFSIQAA